MSRGMYATVDDEDFDWLSQWKWSFMPVPWKNTEGKGYAMRSEYHPRKTVFMHREIFRRANGSCPKQLDHHDGNGLHNKKKNLRPATGSQNCHNMGKNRRICTTSQYKGVSFWKSRGKWEAEIYIRNKRVFLGFFTDEHDAALAYNREAKKRFGEFARLNWIRRSK